ncbi:PP2B [Hepatospora eriocheir]|uniref:PP2B n=1 Tax=Hepatospora eriocheir TaxID=1081669 RepID=A0A1X0QAF1_9MICR|nr:PP2B [Hepatospora eriocheir]
MFKRSKKIEANMQHTAHKVDDKCLLDQKSLYLDYKVVIEHFNNHGVLTEIQVAKIIRDAHKILLYEPNVISINNGSYIAGELKGNYTEFITFIEKFNLNKLSNSTTDLNKATNYLLANTIIFTGNYINEGYFSTEILLTLLLLKCHFPKNIILLRGAEESYCKYLRGNFKTECLKKYNMSLFNLFIELFYSLPICAIIQNEAFVSHAGVPNVEYSLKQIKSYNRFKQRPLKEMSHAFVRMGFEETKPFLKKLNLVCSIKCYNSRSGKIKQINENIKEYDTVELSSLQTNFIYYDHLKITKIKIDQKEDPYVLPEYRSIFYYSLPFIKSNVKQFLEETNHLKDLQILNRSKSSFNLNIDSKLPNKNNKDNILHMPITTKSREKRSISKLGLIEAKSEFLQSLNEMSLGDYCPIVDSEGIKIVDENYLLFTEKVKERLKKKGIKEATSKRKRFFIF